MSPATHSLGAQEIEAELAKLREETRDLRLKAGAALDLDDEKVLFDQYVAVLGELLAERRGIAEVRPPQGRGA